jgi:8-oxo-dGTP diphosphatase
MRTVVVAAAVIERDGQYLITKRQAGVHLEGHWEFPGGKCDAGETIERCLARELREELNVDAVVGDELLTTTHEYGDCRVELHFLRCAIRGTPTPQQGQAMRWAARSDLRTFAFPPADAELIARLAGEP